MLVDRDSEHIAENSQNLYSPPISNILEIVLYLLDYSED